MPVVEDSDRVLPLLRIGDEVITDEGPGVLTGVQFQTAQYNRTWELEPPSLEVELDSGDVIHTCLCAVELPHTQKGTRLLHQEFNRLWPPRTDQVPEDADMLIPEGDEEVVREGLKEANMRRRYAEKAKLISFTPKGDQLIARDNMGYSYTIDVADRDEFERAYQRFFSIPLLRPITREQYEALGRQLGIKVYPDEELGDYGDEYGSYDFWTYGWLNDRLESPLRQSRWFGLKREQPAQEKAPVQETIPEMEGQLWEPCERCGREPSYMPLHLCKKCWPQERTAEMKSKLRKAELPDEGIRIYIADLAAYNAGKLVGEWVDLPADEDELEEIMDRLSHGGRQDIAIHDYEAPFRIEEFESITQLNEAMQELEDSHVDAEVVMCVKEDGGYPDWSGAIMAAEDAHVVDVSDRYGGRPSNPEEELGHYYVDEVYGSVEQLPDETIEMYFDYERFGRDWAMDIDEYEEPEAQEYYEQFSSDREYGEAIVDDFGGVAEAIGDRAARYFDYAAFGRDVAMDYFLCGNLYIRVD